MQVLLTVGDHEQNGFVYLGKWSHLTETEARTFIAEQDRLVSDEAEPDIETAAFTFILDLWDDDWQLIDSGKRYLPTQQAMALAPEPVRRWLNDRPAPDYVAFGRIPELARDAIAGAMKETPNG